MNSAQKSKRPRVTGFTLIEVMVALVILAVAVVGSMGALIAAGKELKDGQTRQVRGLLGDSSARRWMLASKLPTSPLAVAAALAPLATACPTPCSGLPIGAAPWAVDATPVVAGDLSTGAYFQIFRNGEIQQITASTTPISVANGTACSAVPTSVYCRETLITRSPAPIVTASSTWNLAWPPAATNLPAGTSIYTIWIRVMKGGDTAANAIYFTDSFVQ